MTGRRKGSRTQVIVSRTASVTASEPTFRATYGRRRGAFRRTAFRVRPRGTGRVPGGSRRWPMADSDALLDALERFAETLLTESYGVTDVLHMLTEQVATVVGVTGAGVILERRGRYVYVTSLVDAIADLERIVE